MTRREQQAKQEILKILLEEGYKTYSKLFDMFDLNLTKDPNVVGYMEPSKARIVVNENLSIDQVSFVVRHEILHEYLDHQLRMQQHMGKDEYDTKAKCEEYLEYRIQYQIVPIYLEYIKDGLIKRDEGKEEIKRILTDNKFDELVNKMDLLN